MMTLAQISDTHLLALTDHDPLAKKRADALERCINTINQLPVQPEAVIHTGDMINFDKDNGYGLAFEILSRLKAPFFPTLGNRDSRPDFIQQFLAPHILPDDAPFCQYRVQLKGFDLVCADTKSNRDNMGTSCPERVKEMDHLLQMDTDKPVFIFLHHPPDEIKRLSRPLQFESAEHAKAFTDVFDKYDNIVRILCGHTHRSDVFRIGRHIGSTLPSLATDVRRDSYPDRLINEPIFQVHELMDDGSITSRSHFALRTLAGAD